MFQALALRQSKDISDKRLTLKTSASQHALYGIQHIHINLTLIHCMILMVIF